MDEYNHNYLINGAAIEVYNQLGPGFLEKIYHQALIEEFELRGIPFETEVNIPIYYKGKLLSDSYRADLICFGDTLVEIKAVAEWNKSHQAQIIHYLKATGIRHGLLINFGGPSLQSKSFIF